MTDDDGTFKKPSADLAPLLVKTRKPELPPGTSKVTDIPEVAASGKEQPQQLAGDGNEIPPVPYREPAWSRKCDPALNYGFEVLKNGVIIEEVKQLQSRSFWLFGRLPNCDINMAHPTISRYHAILQYRGPEEEKEEDDDGEEESVKRHASVEPGWYLYDLNSTHGTFLNKQRLPPKTYVRVRVGYMVKLGSSSRSYILTGPAEDEDAPSEMTITEMKELREKQNKLREEMAEIERQERERIEKLKEEEGVNWGMGEDADEETDLAHNPYAMSNNEELFLDDPKKTLRGYFEREGHELDYKLEELSAGSYVCRVELPVDDDLGRPIVAEATHKGKKKEVVVQCALEACRILDRYGLLRQATHEPRRRHKKTSDSDDDDDYLDRTGDVERRRQRKQTKSSAEVHTYEDLIRQESELLEKLEDIEARLQRRQLIEKGTRLPENDDDVDEFLEKLSDDKPYDKFEVRRLRLEKDRLTKDHVTLQKLIKIAKPLDLPSMSGLPGSSSDGKDQLKKKMLPLFGKRNKLSASFGIKKSEIKVGGSTSAYGEEVEEDEEDGVAAGPPKKGTPKKVVELVGPEIKIGGSTSAYGEEVEEDEEDGVAAEPPKKGTSKKVVEPAGPKRVHGPSFNPDLLEQHRQKVKDAPPEKQAKAATPEEPKKRKSEADCEEPEETDSASSSKKKRSRNRAGRERNRDNVDFDDSEELQAEDKNVEWVPPEGQSGDGITSLNQKYGY